MKKKLIAGAVILASVVAGYAIHMTIFGLAYFGSPYLWLIVCARTGCAVLGSLLYVRYVSRSIGVLLAAFLGLECGPLLMAAWALFNYSETGAVGFNAALWLVPFVADALGAVWGYRIGLRLRERTETLLKMGTS